MLKNHIFSSAIVLAGGLFATTALANTGEAGMHKSEMKHGETVSFEQVDQNGDGYISKSEFESSGAFQVQHDQLDMDNDGRVNQSEFAAFERTQQGTSEQGYEQGTQYQEQSELGTEPAEQPDSDY